jgi:hypothetical protein
MRVPFIGSEAIAVGSLTPYALRTRFVKLYPDVYVSREIDLTASVRAEAAWLWSRRNGVVAGRSAAALHGAKWVDSRLPAEIHCSNRRPPAGIRTWSDAVADDEIEIVHAIAVTTPERTALDIASRYPLDAAVAAIDALARRTRLKMADVDLIAERYKGRRGIRRARKALDLVDAGAESPRETWLRLLLIRGGFPRPPPRYRSTTSTVCSSPYWTWDGRKSKSPPSTTGINTERTGGASTMTSAAPKRSTNSAGFTFG